MKEIDLYENQEIIHGQFYTKYLCVHDDTFGREKTKEELFSIIYNSVDRKKYTSPFNIIIRIVSKNEHGKVNVFVLEVATLIDKPIHLWVGDNNEYKELNNNIIDNLELIYYYEVIPCNYNGGYDL